jgi:hypothetical protein
MILRRLPCGPCVAEIVVCSLGLLASLIPAIVYTDPFWGLKTYVDRELFSNDAQGVIVIECDNNSPVQSAGLRPHDRVISFNGKPVQFSSFRNVLAQVKPGEAIEIGVKRDGKEIRLEYKGETPKLEGVLFFDWQFVSAPAFLVLLLLLIATQPLMPAPLWRAIIVVLIGLTIMIATIVIEATRRIPWSWVWESKPIDHSPPQPLHFTLAAAVLLMGLALSFLGALRVRACLIRRAQPPAADDGPTVAA